MAMLDKMIVAEVLNTVEKLARRVTAAVLRPRTRPAAINDHYWDLSSGVNFTLDTGAAAHRDCFAALAMTL